MVFSRVESQKQELWPLSVFPLIWYECVSLCVCVYKVLGENTERNLCGLRLGRVLRCGIRCRIHKKQKEEMRLDPNETISAARDTVKKTLAEGFHSVMVSTLDSEKDPDRVGTGGSCQDKAGCTPSLRAPGSPSLVSFLLRCPVGSCRSRLEYLGLCYPGGRPALRARSQTSSWLSPSC